MEISQTFIHTNQKTFDSPKCQYFSFPFGLITYITANPKSAEGLEKIHKTCKHFFAKNKIVVVNRSLYPLNGFWQDIIVTELAKHFMGKFKFWLNNDLMVYKNSSMEFLNSIYCCNLKSVLIHSRNLSFDELRFLVNGGKINFLRFDENNIRDINGDLILCDKILSLVPNVKCFRYSCEIEVFSSTTLKNMNSLKLNSKFTYFELSIHELSPDANVVSLLCKFIKKNSKFDRMYKKQLFEFHFMMNNSEIYRSNFKDALDDMLQEWRAINKTCPNIKIN